MIRTNLTVTSSELEVRILKMILGIQYDIDHQNPMKFSKYRRLVPSQRKPRNIWHLPRDSSVKFLNYMETPTPSSRNCVVLGMSQDRRKGLKLERPTWGGILPSDLVINFANILGMCLKSTDGRI